MTDAQEEPTPEWVYLGSWNAAPWQEQVVPGSDQSDGQSDWIDVTGAAEEQWLAAKSLPDGYYEISVALGNGTGQLVFARGLPAAMELLDQWARTLMRLRELRESFDR